MMKHLAFLAAMNILSCGGRVAPSLEATGSGPTADAGAEVLVSYTVGHCGGARGPRCGYSDSEYRNSPCCAPSFVRENADTYTVRNDCTMVHSTGVGFGASRHIFSES